MTFLNILRSSITKEMVKLLIDAFDSPYFNVKRLIFIIVYFYYVFLLSRFVYKYAFRAIHFQSTIDTLFSDFFRIAHDGLNSLNLDSSVNIRNCDVPI